jgi:hypothetical protein
MIVTRFYCGNCGYGPFDVDDNREAPIPFSAAPVSVFDPENDGQTVSGCPACGDCLPDFVQPGRGLHHRGVPSGVAS